MRTVRTIGVVALVLVLIGMTLCTACAEDTGERGPRGDSGDQGVQGIQGEKGDTGEQGIQGAQGVQGEQGLKGDEGEQSLQGESLIVGMGQVIDGGVYQGIPTPLSLSSEYNVEDVYLLSEGRYRFNLTRLLHLGDRWIAQVTPIYGMPGPEFYFISAQAWSADTYRVGLAVEILNELGVPTRGSFQFIVYGFPD